MRWISGEIHVSYESLIELMFNYGVGAFLKEMRDPDSWIYQRKNEHISPATPELMPNINAARTTIRQSYRRSS